MFCIAYGLWEFVRHHWKSNLQQICSQKHKSIIMTKHINRIPSAQSFLGTNLTPSCNLLYTHDYADDFCCHFSEKIRYQNMKTITPLFFFLLVFIGHAHAQESFDSLIVLQRDTVFFDFAKYDIRPEAETVIQRVAAEFMGKQGRQIRITAHTDAIGTGDANLALSENRAQAVKDSLVAKGIAADLITTEVFGENAPIADNDSEAGRQRNRRATISQIKSVKLVRLKGRVVNPKDSMGIAADITIKTKGFQDSLKTDSSGYFEYPVPDQTVVGFDIYAPGFFFSSKMLKAEAGVMKPLTIELNPAKAGEVVDLKNLYFVGNQAVLLARSKPELPKVLKFMQINPDIKIEIAGHINRPNHPPVPPESWDYQLSVRRAKLVYQYLLDNGISEERVTFKGYGNSEMRYPTATSLKEQELNRRVEIRVLETGKKLGEIGADG